MGDELFESGERVRAVIERLRALPSDELTRRLLPTPTPGRAPVLIGWEDGDAPAWARPAGPGMRAPRHRPDHPVVRRSAPVLVTSSDRRAIERFAHLARSYPCDAGQLALEIRLADVGGVTVVESQIYPEAVAGILARAERALRWVLEHLGKRGTPASDEKPPAKGPHHSGDYTEVFWYGRRFRFTKQQARVIDMLWNEGPLSEETIAERLDPAGNRVSRFRLRDAFKVRKERPGKRPAQVPHEAWGFMIQPFGKGQFGLAPPKKEKSRLPT